MILGISALVSIAVGWLFIELLGILKLKLWWSRYVKLFAPTTSPKPTLQQGHHILAIAAILISTTALVASLLLQRPALLAVAIAVIVLPWGIQKRNVRQHAVAMNEQMDNMLANLANAVSVTGNLFNAIEDVAQGEAEPMRSSLQHTIGEIKLGKTEEEALQRFADRSQIPLLQTAITAVIVGKQSGGNLGRILSTTAEGIREIKRLEGVLKVKTAEGRNQAWVMGMMPIFLCGVLQIVSPNWLTPIWTTPVGWGVLCICILLEGCAIVLIRKILAVVL